MRSWKIFLPLLASSLCFAAQPDRISVPIDSSQTVALTKSHHPEAQPQNDTGPVDPSFKLTSITMLMAPSPAQQKALDELLAEQQDRNSPYFHQWLTPSQFADRFGLSPSDLAKVTTWLSSQGFQVLRVGGSRNSIVFGGTAAQVQKAFHTEIHNYRVDGHVHFANTTPVLIPAALDGLVSSIMGLHSFVARPATHIRGRSAGRRAQPDYYGGDYVFPNFLAPGDIATIYDINPLYNAATPVDGTGQTLGIIGETDVYLADLNDFRAGFNLNQISGCTLNSSGVITACNSTYFQYVPIGSDPGTTYPCGDLSEADLDLEFSGAIARNAQIVFFNDPFVYDPTTCQIISGGGVFSALTAAIDPSSGSIIAPVLSMSYGSCEASLDGTSLETVLQQANAEGITVMNSSGDQGAAACDYGPPGNPENPPYSPAEYGFAVNYPASSPEVTGVGGTSISLANDSYPNPATAYWATGNLSYGDSALQYIPEQPWNDDEEFAAYCHAPASGDKFCSTGGGTTGWQALSTSATSAQVQADIWISAGGGGASNCFYVDGNDVCLGAGAGPSSGGALAQPSYQQNVPNAPAGVRYVPDVSLLASPDFPGYIFCTPQSELSSSTSSTSNASTCAGGISTAISTYGSIVGGTSASSPIFAGMVTLLNQYLGTSGLGNINPTLYTLAASRTTNHAFHSITSGDNNVTCTATTPSGYPSNIVCPGSGVLGYSATNSVSSTGYNLVNGLGSVDLNSLAVAWAASRTTGSSVTLATSSTGINAGQSITLTATISPASGVGSVSFSTLNNGITTVIGSAAVNTPYLTATTGTAIFTTTAMPAGTNVVTATYQGDATITSSTSSAVTVNVTQPDFSFPASVTFSPASVPAGQSVSTQLTITPVVGAATVNFSPASCSGLPAGATCSFNPSSVTFGGVTPVGTTTVTISTAANMTVPTGTQTVTITGSVSTGGSTHTTSGTFTITATNQSFTLTSSNATYQVSAGSPANINLTVNGAGSPIAFSPAALPLTYTCTQSSLPSQAACVFGTNGGNAVAASTLALTITTTGPTSQLRNPCWATAALSSMPCCFPACLELFFAAAGRKRAASLFVLLLVLGVSTLGLVSCGGSSNHSQNNGGTPAGSYSVVVNATSAGPNALTATYTVKLTVIN